jgi:hypothetical protein
MDNKEPERIAGLTREEFAAHYKEYERKMKLFEDGPTTTYFEQLTAKGMALPDPGSITDSQLTIKLREVIAGLVDNRVYLQQTDHLSDRELYVQLWNEVLREETPAIDEIGFSTHMNLATHEPDVYAKYYADERQRERWKKEYPGEPMPAHEDPLYHRDVLLPRAPHDRGPDAREWLRAHPSQHAFASNRFPTTQDALAFVERLYELGATKVTIENVMMLPNHDWLPYADTLIVTPPGGPARHALVEFIEEEGKPDEDDGEAFGDRGEEHFQVWWD